MSSQASTSFEQFQNLQSMRCASEINQKIKQNPDNLHQAIEQAQFSQPHR